MITVRFARAIAMAVLLGACATPGGTARESGQDRTTLTAANLKAHEKRTLYDVIRLERPQWLSTRGPTNPRTQTGDEIVVYRDGVKVGGIENLRDITADLVASVRFLSGPEAQSRFGMDHQSGAILITTVKD